jgi:hypothetical protein
MSDIDLFFKESGYLSFPRSGDKTTMLVKEFDKVKWGKVEPYPAIVMEKLDGVCGLAVNISGECRIFSRTGKRLKNVEDLEYTLSSHPYLRNQVLCFELVNSYLSLEQITGICSPLRTKPL